MTRNGQNSRPAETDPYMQGFSNVTRWISKLFCVRLYAAENLDTDKLFDLAQVPKIKEENPIPTNSESCPYILKVTAFAKFTFQPKIITEKVKKEKKK